MNLHSDNSEDNYNLYSISKKSTLPSFISCDDLTPPSENDFRKGCCHIPIGTMCIFKRIDEWKTIAKQTIDLLPIPPCPSPNMPRFEIRYIFREYFISMIEEKYQNASKNI